MRNNPIVSIITPLFNGKRFLAGAIENVIGQGIDDIEHIVVDGGSTDGSLEIVRSYGEHYPHIRWVSEPDRGQSDAMNKGIRMARAEFISFLNADDFYAPGVFDRVRCLLEEAAGTDRKRLFLIANTRVIDDRGQLLWVNRPRLRRSWMLTGLNFQRFPINPTAYFYNKSLHDDVGLYSEGHQHGHMDLEFVLRAIPVATIRYFNEWWGNFRLYEGTITQKLSAAREGEAKVMATLRSFHGMLPPRQRWWVSLLFALADSAFYRYLVWFLYRVRFALRTPGRAIMRAREILTGAGRPMQKV